MAGWLEPGIYQEVKNNRSLADFWQQMFNRTSEKLNKITQELKITQKLNQELRDEVDDQRRRLTNDQDFLKEFNKLIANMKVTTIKPNSLVILSQTPGAEKNWNNWRASFGYGMGAVKNIQNELERVAGGPVLVVAVEKDLNVKTLKKNDVENLLQQLKKIKETK